jgi:hypothetical protein
MRRQRHVRRARQYAANLGHVHRPERERLLRGAERRRFRQAQSSIWSVPRQGSGEVRISYPFLGRGGSFRDMTKKNRLQIEAMIDTIHAAVDQFFCLLA